MYLSKVTAALLANKSAKTADTPKETKNCILKPNCPSMFYHVINIKIGWFANTKWQQPQLWAVAVFILDRPAPCHRTTERILATLNCTRVRFVHNPRHHRLKCIFSVATESSLGLACADCPHDSCTDELERELDLDYSRWAQQTPSTLLFTSNKESYILTLTTFPFTGQMNGLK